MEVSAKSAGVLAAVPDLASSSGSVAVGDKRNAGKPKKRFLDEFADVMRRRHLSLRTEQAYVGWVRRFILFHN